MRFFIAKLLSVGPTSFRSTNGKEATCARPQGLITANSAVFFFFFLEPLEPEIQASFDKFWTGVALGDVGWL